MAEQPIPATGARVQALPRPSAKKPGPIPFDSHKIALRVDAALSDSFEALEAFHSLLEGYEVTGSAHYISSLDVSVVLRVLCEAAQSRTQELLEESFGEEVD